MSRQPDWDLVEEMKWLRKTERETLSLHAVAETVYFKTYCNAIFQGETPSTEHGPATDFSRDSVLEASLFGPELLKIVVEEQVKHEASQGRKLQQRRGVPLVFQNIEKKMTGSK